MTHLQNESLTLVIPAFNEAEAIGPVVSSLRATFPHAEIIVVDDGSTDPTSGLATAAGATVIRHPVNRGYGASLKTGILASTGHHILFCDADGQHRVQDVLAIANLRATADMVVGARSGILHGPRRRRPGKIILRHFANYLAGQRIPDLNSGLRVIRRDILLKYLHLMPEGFSFSTTSTFAMLKGNHTIHWEPITIQPRKGASTVRQWKHGPQTLLLILRLTVLFEPLRVFLPLTGLLLLLTLGGIAKDLITTPGQGLGAITIIGALATLLVFLFGLLCDQVSSIRREMHAYHQR